MIRATWNCNGEIEAAPQAKNDTQRKKILSRLSSDTSAASLAFCRSRFSHFFVDSSDEQIKCRANHKDDSRNNGARNRRVVMSGEIRFNGCGQQPHLHDQQNCDQRERAIDGGQAAAFSRFFWSHFIRECCGPCEQQRGRCRVFPARHAGAVAAAGLAEPRRSSRKNILRDTGIRNDFFLSRKKQGR